MSSEVLIPGGDPMGRAIYEYHKFGKAEDVVVHSSMFDDDVIPIETLFRSLVEMPAIERVALEAAYGDILDVGAGSGCHSLALKGLGKRSVAVDISPLSVQVMKERELDARLVNFYDPSFTETFDTILMLMNGTGIIGNLDNIHTFFARVKQLLKPGGCLLIDSSDLRYLFEEEEDGSMITSATRIELTNLITQHHLPAIFTERSGSVSAAGIIARETGCSSYALDMAMAGDSYFEAMYHNIDILKEALG